MSVLGVCVSHACNVYPVVLPTRTDSSVTPCYFFSNGKISVRLSIIFVFRAIRCLIRLLNSYFGSHPFHLFVILSVRPLWHTTHTQQREATWSPVKTGIITSKKTEFPRHNSLCVFSVFLSPNCWMSWTNTKHRLTFEWNIFAACLQTLFEGDALRSLARCIWRGFRTWNIR